MIFFKNQRGSRRNLVNALHYIVLFTMLHSTFVAPAQGIIEAWVHNKSGQKYRGFRGESSHPVQETGLPTIPGFTNVQANPVFNTTMQPRISHNKSTETPAIARYKADLEEGVIGISKDKPVDNPFDNIFNVMLDRLPLQQGEKVYLTYELYGVEGHHSVAHSINSRFSSGGYLVKLQQGWSTQKEELNPQWLNAGVNKILFTIPRGAGYQYKIKNLSIQIEKNSSMPEILVLHNQNTVLTKEGKIYIKGFLRGNYAGAKIQAGDTWLDVNDNEFEGYITLSKQAKNNKMLAVSAISGEDLLGREILFLDNLVEADRGFAIERKEAGNTKLFTAHQSNALAIDGASIMVNDSALSKDYNISIIQLRNIDIAPMESGMVNVTKGGKGYRFLPDGATFNKPVSISVEYDTLLLPAGYTAKDIRTYFFDTNSKKWRQVQKDTLDTKLHLVTSNTTHFTDYINGIIQTPESPETSAFMPTMMNDIKAADPSAEITLISPPQASQKGDANISYPIKIPAGRKGLQPELTLQYSNSASQAWLGLGWDLSIPALSIDSRWGVPLFDPVNETELYSLNGEMLMFPEGYLPHRHYGETGYNVTTQARGTATKQFTPRKQGSFTKIERLGNSTSSYFWKVTGTDGSISWYGGKDDEVVENAVIHQGGSQTPIIHWALYMVQDVFGNTIKYTYTQNTISGQSGQFASLNGSKEMYLSQIKYTGYNDTDGDYSVTFINQGAIRPDVTFSARLGIKQSSSRLLDEITVHYQNQLIRKYRFEYITGRFGKQLLSKATELDANSTEFYHHDFEYYDDVAENGGNLFKSPVNIEVPTVEANYSMDFGNLLDASKISSTQSTGSGYTIKPTVGLQLRVGSINGDVRKTLLVGASFGENNSKSKGKVSLTDIDGDGLDDIVFSTGGGLRYYPGTVTYDEANNRLTNSFDYTERAIHNISDYSYGKTNTKTVFGDSWDINFVSFFAGTQRTKSKSETTTYFIDANNDGLIDIVKNGTVHFNHIDDATGEPTFTTNSDVTPNLVIKGANPVGEPQPTPEEQEVEPETPVEFNDNYDVVKVWRSSCNTTGSILVNFECSGPGTAEYTIERKKANGNFTELFHHQHLEPGPPLQYVLGENSSTPAINFEKGDIYYFRLHHNETGPNPNIKARFNMHIYDTESPYVSVGGESEDYNNGYGIMSSNAPESVPGTGTVSIEWPPFVPTQLYDVIKYRIYQRTIDSQGNNNDVLIYPPLSSPAMGVVAPGSTTPVAASSNLNSITVNDDNTSFVFEAWSEANTFLPNPNNIGSVAWRPKLTYHPSQAASDAGVISYSKIVVPHYNVYHEEDYNGHYILMPSATDPNAPSWTTPATPQTYGVKPNINVSSGYFDADDNAEFVFTVRGNTTGIYNQVAGSRKVIITNGVISVSDSSPITLCSGCNLATQPSDSYNRTLLSFYVDEEEIEVFEKYMLATANNIVTVGFGSWGSGQTHHTRAVGTYYNNLKHLGLMAAGNWGQFLYNEEYDDNPNTPVSAYGKLINTDIVMHPFDGLTMPSSPILSNTCDPNLSNADYIACMEQSIAGAANIPDENTDPENINVENLVSDLQNDFDDFTFEFPLLVMQPYMDNDPSQDRWFGLYNSQYSGIFDTFRAGGVEEATGNSAGGGGGLSYPEFADEEEPEQEAADVSTGMNGINKIHRSSSRNNSIGYGSLTYSTSNSLYSNTVTDFTDINGDAYPDIMTAEALQRTNMTGGHLPSVGNPLYGNLTEEESNAKGLALSRTYLVSGVKSGTISSGKSINLLGYHHDGPPTTYNVGPASARIGIGVNLAGDDETKAYWIDINGDGLTDKIKNGASGYGFALNKGQNTYNMAALEPFSQLNSTVATPAPVSVDFGAGIIGDISQNAASNLMDLLTLNSYSIGVSASANLGFSGNASNTESIFVDINSDGLSDRVEGSGVKFNSGTSFGSSTPLSSSGSAFFDLDADSKSKGFAISGSLGAFFGFPICCAFIPVLHIKGGVTFDASSSLSIGQTEKLYKDLNGDGFMDFIVYDENVPILQDGRIKAYYSAIGRTNMLKTVHNPIKGSFTMDYAANAKSYNNHNSCWVMTELVINDGYDKVNDGEDSYLTRFEYENAYYDRREREFYGFETVKTIDYTVDEDGEPADAYRTSVAKYHNQSYFLKGFLKESYILKGNDENSLYTKTVNTYAIKQLNANGTVNLTATPSLAYDTGGTEGRRGAVVLLTQTDNYVYELDTTPVANRVQMEYNNLARVIKYKYLGDPNDASDNYTTEIDYHSTTTLQGHNIIGIPQEVRVKDNNNVVVRKKTTGQIDQNTGAIGLVTLKLNAAEDAVTQMEYDVYGNITKVTLPPNEGSQQMVYAYEYDSVMHKFLTGIQDSYGYISVTDYDVALDKVVAKTDITSNIIQYEYDTFGRLITAIGPNEFNNNIPYTIRMRYFPVYNSSFPVNIDEEDFVPVAVTQHYDRQHPNNDVETYTFIDGMARVVQIKKDIEYDIQGNGSPIESMSVSGKVSYDMFGRAAKQYHPYFEAKDPAVNYIVNEADTGTYSSAGYDELDRTIQGIDAAGSVSAIVYSIDTSNTYPLHKTRSVTDQDGTVNVVSEVYKDANGRVSYDKKELTGAPQPDLITRFTYNAIGELISYIDAQALTITYNYDMAGRKIKLVHPDTGITTYGYDKAGHIIKMQTANLAADTSLPPAERFIKYIYEYNRLVRIQYPDINGNANIANVKYSYGDSGNEAGRVIHQEDATGSQDFEYTSMGEVGTETRTVVGPNIPTRTFKTVFEYDSWNRIQRIIYPDGEKVDYYYNMGGKLSTITGYIEGNEYPYVKQINYDYFEQRSYMLYGNGTENYYLYTPELRRLQNLYAITSMGDEMRNIGYGYDKVGNVIAVENDVVPNPVNNIGGYMYNKYTYDSLNRLVSSSGIFAGDATLEQNHDAHYDALFEYNETHGLTIKDQYHTIDGNEAQASTFNNEYHYIDGTHKVEYIQNVNFSGLTEYFSYDLNGNTVNRGDTGGVYRDFYWDESDRLRVVDDQATMQHYIYDATGQRILKAATSYESIYTNGTLTGTNATINGYTTYPNAYIVVNGDGEYTKHYYAGSERVVTRIGEETAEIFEDCPTCRQSAPATDTAAPAFEPEKLKQIQIADLTHILKKAKRGTPVFKAYEKKDADAEEKSLASDDQYTTNNSAPPQQFPYNNIYFYHPDHLGTSSYLTDANGMPYQFFLNLPFGETMLEQHSLTEDYETPYKFNGKELDAETGFYYYGARYFDPRVSIWMSVDPLTEEYQGVNPYIYCLQNPVNLIDPDGKRVYFVPGLGHDPSKPSIYVTSMVRAYGFPGYEKGSAANKEFMLVNGGSVGTFSDMVHVWWRGSLPTMNYMSSGRIHNTALAIASGIKEDYNESISIVGASQGSVTSAQAAIQLLEHWEKYELKEQPVIDNLVLVGTPIQKGSPLWAKLQEYKEKGLIKNIEYKDFQASARGEFDFVTGLSGFTPIDGLPRGILSAIGMAVRSIFGKDTHVNMAKDKGFGAYLRRLFDNNKKGNDKDNGEAWPIK